MFTRIMIVNMQSELLQYHYIIYLVMPIDMQWEYLIV